MTEAYFSIYYVHCRPGSLIPAPLPYIGHFRPVHCLIVRIKVFEDHNVTYHKHIIKFTHIAGVSGPWSRSQDIIWAVIHKSSFDMRVYKIQTPFETTSFRKKTPFCLLENIQKWRSTSLLAPSNISQKSIVMYGYILHYLTKPISDTQVKTTYIHYIAVSILLLCIIICEIIWCK